MGGYGMMACLGSGELPKFAYFYQKKVSILALGNVRVKQKWSYLTPCIHP